MHKKSLKQNDIWFICRKCKTAYDEQLEEVTPEEDIIAWAYSPTSDANKWDALEKVKIREAYEDKKRKGKR